MRSASLFVAFSLVAAACGDNLGVGAESLTVSPSSVTVDIGDTTTVAATYSLGGDSVAADDVTWSTSNAATATVSGSGSTATITGVAEGSTTITASGRGLTATVAVAVQSTTPVLVSIAVTPSAPSIADGTMLQMTATGTFSDNSTEDVTLQATWASDDNAVATVAGNGVVLGKDPGDASISATVGTISGSTTLTVTSATLESIAVTPTDPTVALGVDQAFTATGTFSDTTTQNLTIQVTWSSSDEAIATIDAAGLASTLDPGETTIRATLGTVFGESDLTVTDAVLTAIAVTPTDPDVPLGLTQQFTATGTFSDGTTPDITDQVAWTSSDGSVATISDTVPTKGLADTHANGTTTITATSGTISGTSTLDVTGAALLSIDVTPVDPDVPVGVDAQFTARGHYTGGATLDITDQVLWESSDETIATISNATDSEGVATPLAPGTTTITATSGTIVGSSQLTVIDALLVSIEVTPVDPTVPNGIDPQFTAVGHYTGGGTQNITDQVLWASSNETVATISNASPDQGLATTLAPGTTTVTATSGVIVGSSDLTVSAALLVSFTIAPLDPSISLGATQQFTATGTFSDGSTADITDQVLWESADPAIATISNAAPDEGLATSVATGTVTISATLGAEVHTTDLTIAGVTLVSIAIAPTSSTVGIGGVVQYAATGTFSDTSTADLTTSVAWNTTDATIATISSAPGTEGRARAVNSGSVTITATSGVITSNSATLATTDPCHLTINELQAAGVTSSDEWVELYNGCAWPIDLSGWRLAYRSAAGVTDQTLQVLAGTVAAGGFRLYSGVGYTGAQPADGTFGSASGALAAAGGGVAVRAGAADVGPIQDSLGYGTATNAFVEIVVAVVPPATQSIARTPDGHDTNSNLLDFTLDPTPTPRLSNN